MGLFKNAELEHIVKSSNMEYYPNKMLIGFIFYPTNMNINLILLKFKITNSENFHLLFV